VAYNRPSYRLPDDFNGQPPIFINSFVDIGRDGSVLSGNRNNREDSTIHFYKSQLSEGSLDSLNDLAIRYVKDKSYVGQDPTGTVDSYYLLCLLIETRDKNVLIEFLDSHSIPGDLKTIVSNFWKFVQEKHPVEMTSYQFYSVQKKLDGILLKRSRLLHPPIKTIIKFIPPKVDSTSSRK
jgi:hypothetical protein